MMDQEATLIFQKQKHTFPHIWVLEKAYKAFTDEWNMIPEIDREEFERAVKPAVEWLRKNGDPHNKIIIQQDYVELLSGELGLSTDSPD